MSLLDLLRLMKKNWIVLLVAALVCGAAGLVYELTSKNDDGETAIARIISNGQMSGLTSLADAEVRGLLDPNNEEDMAYSVTMSVPSGQTTLVITAKGPDADRCIQVANAVATATVEKATDLFTDFENPWSGYADLAKQAEVKEPVSASVKYVVAGVFAGLFLALCFILIRDIKRRPVKSLEGMQDIAGLPVLEKLPATNGERLLANVRFASEHDDLRSVFVVPLSAASPAAEVCKLLSDAAAADLGATQMDTQTGAPLSNSMAAAYAARETDAVLVVAKQWDDSYRDLESTVAELQLAGAKLVGLVFAQ